MKNRKNNDVFQILSDLQTVLSRKPNPEKMFEEIRMMRFKIKPLMGDISLVNVKNNQLIEALWGLGKIDEFFHKKFKQLSLKDKDTFFRVVNDIKGDYEQQLNRVGLKEKPNVGSSVELEIFKEKAAKKTN